MGRSAHSWDCLPALTVFVIFIIIITIIRSTAANVSSSCRGNLWISDWALLQIPPVVVASYIGIPVTEAPRTLMDKEIQLSCTHFKYILYMSLVETQWCTQTKMIPWSKKCRQSGWFSERHFYPTFFFSNWILLTYGFYTWSQSKLSFLSPFIIGSKLTTTSIFSHIYGHLNYYINTIWSPNYVQNTFWPKVKRIKNEKKKA